MSSSDRIARDRDALPTLPMLPWLEIVSRTPGMNTKARAMVRDRVRDSVAMFRTLAKGTLDFDHAGEGPAWQEATLMQKEIGESILVRWTSWVPDILAGPSTAAARLRLLGSANTSYCGLLTEDVEAGEMDSQGRLMLPKGSMCDVDVEELALSPPGTQVVEITEVCPDARTYFAKMEERMLFTEEELSIRDKEIKTYTDPALKVKSKVMRLAQRLWEAGALGFTDEKIEEISLFGVIKKYIEDPGGARPVRSIRPVWDLRAPNRRWRSPPFVPLGSPASFCHLDLSGLKEGDKLLSVTGDVPDFFTRLRTPPKCWKYFVLPLINAQEFADFMRNQGTIITLPATAKFLALSILAMGWSWAPFLAHMTLVAIVDKANDKAIRAGRIIYGAPTPQLKMQDEDGDFGEEMVSWEYIDDYGAASSTSSSKNPTATLAEYKRKTKQGMKDSGLPVHKEEELEGIKALGAMTSERPYRLSVPKPKLVLLIIVTMSILADGWATTKEIEKVLGCWSWSMMFFRPALSLLDQVYFWIRESTKTCRRRLTKVVLAELRALIAITPWMMCNLETPFYGEALMTDSSDIGYGVCVTPATTRELRAESQFTEMRGWMVSLEDQYAAVEESVWMDGETAMATDELEEVNKLSPTHWPVRERVFRFLHFFSGFRRIEDLEWWLLSLGEKYGLIIEVWSVDVAIDPSMDLCQPEALNKLRGGCRDGYFHGGGGGPPCGTWSRARFNQACAGPRPLRTRDEPWGRTDIIFSASEEKKLTLGTLLLEGILVCLEELFEMNGMGWMEHPVDPGLPPFPSSWATELVKTFIDRTGAIKKDIEQRMYGQASQKGTSIMIFGKHMRREMVDQQLSKRCNHKSHKMTLQSTDKNGVFKTSAAQIYPSGLCRALAHVVVDTFSVMMRLREGPDPLAEMQYAHHDRFTHPTPGRSSEERRLGQRIRAPPMTSAWTIMSRWRVLYSGWWRMTEHTNINETRAVVGILRHMARSRTTWNHKFLVFTDSMVALGALAKGRSSARPLLRLCRQACAYSCVFSLRLLLRYVPSEKNIADGPSRGEGLGVASGTQRAHADRLPGMTNAILNTSPQVERLTVLNVGELLSRGRRVKGFAGG
ncbi:unnamed protein product [Polarella glacialis]|uniref:Uncharacterized protein n=1 Tax=Polarella glacialis TaxID=89957 RepID=A0A813KP89_POLGL|nr:unnamed protein product [Polarella glacialis]